jgi:hypothetical protein
VAPFLDTSDETAAKRVFAELYALEPVLDITGIRPYPEQNSFMNDMVHHGPRSYITAFAYQILSVELLEHAAQFYSSCLSALGEDYRPGVVLFEAFPFNKVIEVPFDATAYANRGKHFNCTVCLRWEGEKHDEWIRQSIRDYVKEARAIDQKVMLERGMKPTEITGYANFHLPGDPPSQAFRTNLPRLIELKRKWDPKGRFNKWFNIPTEVRELASWDYFRWSG